MNIEALLPQDSELIAVENFPAARVRNQSHPSKHLRLVSLTTLVVTASLAALLPLAVAQAQSSVIPLVKPVSFARGVQAPGKSTMPRPVRDGALTSKMPDSAIYVIRPVHLGQPIITWIRIAPPAFKPVSLAADTAAPVLTVAMASQVKSLGIMQTSLPIQPLPSPASFRETFPLEGRWNVVQQIKIIDVGDLIHVRVFDAPELSEDVRVTADGNIHLLLLGDVHVAGMALEAIARRIESTLRSKGLMKKPSVSIELKDFSTQGATLRHTLIQPGEPGIH